MITVTGRVSRNGGVSERWGQFPQQPCVLCEVQLEKDTGYERQTVTGFFCQHNAITNTTESGMLLKWLGVCQGNFTVGDRW